ncbi:MAG: sugar phosphate isomerase/epimerase family protein [Intestinibacillus sp.]
MKLGYNEATCQKRSDVGTDLALCEKYGYDYIELRVDMLKEYLKKHRLSELQQFFAGSRLRPYSLNSIENINFNVSLKWDLLLDLFKFSCEAAQAIGCPYVVLVPTRSQVANTRDEKQVLDDSVKVITTLADLAKPFGVKLAFEPIGDRRYCCTGIRQALEIVNAVGRDDVGLTLDSFTFYLQDKSANMDVLSRIPRDKLFIYHIADSEDLPLGVLDHRHRLFPGDGCIPLKAITDAVRATGYDGILSLELFRPEYWDMEPEEVIRIGADKCRAFL